MVERVRFAVALSEHPDAGVAIGEVVGQVLERIGPGPDMAVLFLTAPHVAEAGRLGRVVRETLGARHLLGATAVSVLAHRQEVEETSAMVLWAGHTGPVDLFRLEPGTPLPPDLGDGVSLLAIGDPFSFDADALLASVPGGTTLVGGLASAGSRPGGNRLLLDDEVFTDGAVVAALPAGLGVRPLVSQGCRPVGDPFTVTAATGNLIRELGGRPALTRLEEIMAGADDNERDLMRRGLHIGLVVDEHRGSFGLGDFIIRTVIGADRSSGAVAIGDSPEVGTTVQFHVRDARTASAELAALVQPLRAESALVFTCNGRGSHLFGRSGHDAEHLSDGLDTTVLGGMFCAGEMGPIGGRHFLHGFTASALLFGVEDAD